MSTILDALSRAERERQMGAAPRIADTLRTAPEPSPGPTRRLKLSGRALLAAGALLTVTGAAWVWLQQTSPPLALSAEPDRPAVGAPSSLARGASSSPSLPVQEKRTGPPATTSQAAHLPAAPTVLPEGAAVTTSTPAGQLERPSAKHEHSRSVVENRSGVRAPAAAPASAVASAPASTASTASTAHAIRPPADVPKGKEDERKIPAGKGSAPSAAPVLPTMAELPETTRGQLPALAVNGYIYAASPKDRSIILNGRLLHEGEDVAPGLKLEQMRPDGVVLEFKGQRFRMAY